jgi:hypothetical protein
MCDSLLVSDIWGLIKQPQGKERVMSMAQKFLRDRISRASETSVLNQVLPPQFIPSADRRENPLCNNEGNDTRHYDGMRVLRYIDKFKPQHYIKPHLEMIARKYSACQEAEFFFVRPIQNDLDWDFRLTLDEVAEKSGQLISVPDNNPAQLKAAMQDAKNIVLGGSNGSQPVLRMILMETRWDHMTLMNSAEWGYDPGRVTLEGNHNIKTCLGFDVVKTYYSKQTSCSTEEDNSCIAGTRFRTGPANNIDEADLVWPSNSIYIVAEPNSLGASYMVDDGNVGINCNGNQFDLWCWLEAGHIIDNVRSVVRIDLVP